MWNRLSTCTVHELRKDKPPGVVAEGLPVLGHSVDDLTPECSHLCLFVCALALASTRSHFPLV